MLTLELMKSEDNDKFAQNQNQEDVKDYEEIWDRKTRKIKRRIRERTS